MKRRSKNFEFHFTMILYDLFKTILVFLIATTFALCLQEADVMNDNIFGVYMLAVAITSSITSGYFWGIVASFCGVVGVNFFFTFPYFALNFTLAGYPVTFGILLLMSILTSALTAKVKQAAILSSIREKRAESLNSMSKALLSANNIDEIMQITIDSVYAANQCSAVLYIGSPISPEKKVTKYVNEKDELILESILEQQVAEQAFQKGEMTGLGTEKTSQNCLGTYIPFSNKDRIYGVLGLLFSKNGYIENDALQFANFMTSQTILAIDRQEIVDESQKILLEKEKENMPAMGAGNAIETRLGSGLLPVHTGEVESAVIAGMGGMLICRILKESEDVAKSLKEWILSPQHDLDAVRQTVWDFGFAIDEEIMVKEDGKYYHIFRCVPGEEREKTPASLFYGGRLLEKQDTILWEELTREEAQYEKVVEGLRRSGTQKAAERLAEIEEKLAVIKEAKAWYK